MKNKKSLKSLKSNEDNLSDDSFGSDKSMSDDGEDINLSDEELKEQEELKEETTCKPSKIYLFKAGRSLESFDGKYQYRVGVIDFLTKYNFSKTLEVEFKSALYRVDRGSVSAQKPHKYQKRFIEFFKQKL